MVDIAVTLKPQIAPIARVLSFQAPLVKSHGVLRVAATFVRCVCMGIVCLGGLGVLAFTAYLGARSLFFPLGAGFDRARFEAIVAEVRRYDIAPGKELELRLDDISNPRSLRLRRDDEQILRGEGVGHVWAARTEGGRLKVVIEIQDGGHAGEYGFACSDEPLTPRRLDENWSTIAVPGPLNIVGSNARIDAHWWSVLNNLE
jgi:hypothetical protein